MPTAAYSSRNLRVYRSRTSLIGNQDIGEQLPADIVTEWRQQLAKYDNYWAWADGRVWDQQDQYYVSQKGHDLPLLFPLQMNPIHTASIIHRNALFGEVPDMGGPMVRPVAIPKNKYGDAQEGVTVTDSARNDAKFVGDLLEMLWYQSAGRSTMLDAGYVSQAIGGCVFKVSYEPWNTQLEPGLPVAFRQVEPEFFLPVYTMYDRWNLLEARIGRMIDAYEAKEVYGVETSANRVLYLEKWTRTEVLVTIDGKPASIMRNGAEVELSGIHGYGLVPIVYIPHEIVGMFYGVPIVHQLANLIKELNGRAADVGDAMRNSIERIYIMTNADHGDLKMKDMGDGIKVMSTGREMAGTQPKKIEHVAPPDLPRGTMEYLEFLQKAVWHDSFTPAVAYGEDEGSQRSALTLAFRMWPLTSHVRTERSLWSEGMRLMYRMALQILSIKQTGDFGDLTKGTPWKLKEQHMGHIIKSDWAPMIPRDRESEVNQLILRHQDGQLSAEGAMEKQGDIEDIDRELERIQKEADETADREAKLAGQVAKQKGALSDTQPPVARVDSD
jgi:hypothetical protein